NRIVAHHGRGLDVVVASRANSAQQQQRQEEPMIAAVAAGASRTEARMTEPRAAETRMTEPRMRDGGTSSTNLPPPDLGSGGPAPRRTEAPPVSPIGPGADPGRDGWLSDLLSRADAPGPGHAAQRGRSAPQQPASGNPLESLSLDISRLMDRNLAAEMWDRYQRGESKAFSKRLYTPAGQKAFDEVARKYRSDRVFKQTVD